MKLKNITFNCGIVLSAILATALAPSALAVISGPYSSDANTLFLWHLDEAAGASTGSAAVGGLNLISVSNPTVLANSDSITKVTTILGGSGATGFGNAALINPGSSDTTGLGLDGNNNGQLGYDLNGGSNDLLPVSSYTGTGGAFTFEALIKLPVLSSGQIISAESGSSVGANRLFQFSMSSTLLRFQNVDSATQELSATIPTTGDNAFVANQWFHVAVVYNGNENTDGNLKLYWTRLDNSQTQANEIFSGNMTYDLSGTGILGVGAEYRGTTQGNLNGSIDEVRISSIARGPSDFVFAIPEPSTLTLVGLSLLGVAMLSRRGNQRSGRHSPCPKP